jgi:hypothetical protein
MLVYAYAIGHDCLDGSSARTGKEEEEVDNSHWNAELDCGQRRDTVASRTLWRPRFVWAVL